MNVPEASPPAHLHRRQALVEAAFRTIAAKGFEGLRVRDVAAQVGINPATLHHYFPTKEDLIQAAVGYTMERLRSWMVEKAGDAGSPRERLHHHLTELHALMGTQPELFTVLVEVTLRARRTASATFLITQRQGWHGLLKGLLSEGLARGEWRQDLDPDSTAWAIMTVMEGVSLRADLDPVHGDKVIGQLLAWIDCSGVPDPDRA
jgi:AcrR family transcriptional regulator